MSDDRDAIHFPEAETIPSFAIAFMGMMFAHAEFEEQVRELQASIMKTPAKLDVDPKITDGDLWEVARPPKTHGKFDQGSSRFGQRPGGKADR
jgi:hypothetical protein